MKKDINIGEAKPYFPDTLPCEYDPPDTKQLDEEDYYESYAKGRGSDACLLFLFPV